MVASDGRFDRELFAMDALMSMSGRKLDLIADVIDGFSQTTGPGSGIDLDLPSLVVACSYMRTLNIPGPWMGMLHGQQWADVALDAGIASGGALQWQQATAELVAVRTAGYQGNFLGVDFWTSNRVKTANGGADRAGAIWGKGGVLTMDGILPPVSNPAVQFLTADQRLRIGIDISERKGTEAVVSQGYTGASKGIEAGVTLISDA